MQQDRQSQDGQRPGESCEAKAGLPWQEVYRHLMRQDEANGSKPDQGAIALLRKTIEHHESPLCLKDLASHVGMSGPEASHCSRLLKMCGLAKRYAVAIGRRRMVFLEPTADGFQFLGARPPVGTGRGGPGHRYCVSRVEEQLQKLGYQSHREAEVEGKRMDLVARKDTSTVFVEVEMTAENAARNAAADIKAAGPDVQILFVCPTKQILRLVKKAAASAVDEEAMGRITFTTMSEFQLGEK